MCRKYWFEGYHPKSQGGTNFSGEIKTYYSAQGGLSIEALGLDDFGWFGTKICGKQVKL